MEKKTLDRQAMPRTSLDYAFQAQKSADRRRVQMVPGQARKAAPGEDPVAHYQGQIDDTELGSPTEDIVSEALRSRRQVVQPRPTIPESK